MEQNDLFNNISRAKYLEQQQLLKEIEQERKRILLTRERFKSYGSAGETGVQTVDYVLKKADYAISTLDTYDMFIALLIMKRSA